LARINAKKGITEAQLRFDEYCESEEIKMEECAIEDYKKEQYPHPGGHYSEIHLGEEIIKDLKKGK